MEKEIIAVFDFDGTLTTKDTFIEFAKFAVGRKKLFIGMIKNSFWLMAWKLKLLDGGKAKQHLFSSLFKGISFTVFQQHCERFASLIESFERKRILDKLYYHIQSDHEVYIISASIPDWIVPWAGRQGVVKGNVLGTEIEIDENGRLTGRFSTPNCNGVEKVRRLKMKESDIKAKEIYAYGDSSGDEALLAIADHGEIVKK